MARRKGGSQLPAVVSGRSPLGVSPKRPHGVRHARPTPVLLKPASTEQEGMEEEITLGNGMSVMKVLGGISFQGKPDGFVLKNYGPSCASLLEGQGLAGDYIHF
ncbi:Neuron Navigator 2 [Manis pentadactyla]|nr:Neuron Navigator 2 [Manis pentadactyla]